MAVGIHHLWTQCPNPEARDSATGFRRWCVRGLVLPIVFWQTWDAVALWGPAWGLQPLTPDFGGSRVSSFAAGSAVVALLTGIAWTSCTLVWLLPQVTARIRRRAELRGWVLLIGLPTLLICLWASRTHQWLLIGSLVTLSLWVLMNAALRLVHVPRVDYARALTRLKSGKYAEAEDAILVQLEEKEDDFEGWMLLASLYVDQFHELAEARTTIQSLTGQPDLTPYQVSHALNRLADWELRLGNDPVGARAALEEIVRRCTGTPFARVAEHRIRQLPLNQAELEEHRQPRTLALPALREARSETSAEPETAIALLEARQEEAQLIERLQYRPDDASLHTRLARLLAERLDRPEEARRQLQRARQLPDNSSTQQAEWLALEASWELKDRRREVQARVLLQRLLREHPGTPQSLAARRRLDLLDQAAAAEQAHPAVPGTPLRIRIALPDSSNPGPPPWVV
ncbi:MAG: hypothetical protein RIS76_1745 [Verrucomicrobiota bacterium]|jgi:tetratricopeptide (TPR) repeat protein